MKRTSILAAVCGLLIVAAPVFPLTLKDTFKGEELDKKSWTFEAENAKSLVKVKDGQLYITARGGFARLILNQEIEKGKTVNIKFEMMPLSRPNDEDGDGYGAAFMLECLKPDKKTWVPWYMEFLRLNTTALTNTGDRAGILLGIYSTLKDQWGMRATGFIKPGHIFRPDQWYTVEIEQTPEREITYHLKDPKTGEELAAWNDIFDSFDKGKFLFQMNSNTPVKKPNVGVYIRNFEIEIK